MKKLHIFLFSILIAIGTLSSANCFELLRGVPNGLGNSIMLSRSSLFSITQVASGGLTSGEGVVTFGGNRKFDLKEFDQFALGSAVRYGHLYAGMLLSSFGQSDLYAERGGQLLLAYQKDSFTVGGTVSGMLMEFGDPFDNLSAVTFGATAAWRTKYIIAAITVDNLNEPKPFESSAAYPRNVTIYSEFRKSDRFSLTGRAFFEGDNTEFGLGQRLLLSSYGELLLGFSTDPFQYGGGVNLFWKQFSLVYAVSYHPDLGLSHTVSLLTHFRIK